MRLAIVIAGLVVVAGGAQADHLEVRRSATLKDDHARNAMILERFDRGDMLQLLDDGQQRDGYYHAQSPTGVPGWIYRTLVRRHAGDLAPTDPASDGAASDSSTDPGPAIPAYFRSRWRHWVDVDGDCQDARQEVLIAESEVQVTFTDARRCTVATGRWTDPYSGQVHTNPRILDIDHMVPLRNAHLSGGWAFDADLREAYANDLDQADHLVAVFRSLNRSKGARGPEEWRPPDQTSWCWYGRAWRAVKERWRLTMTTAEAQSVAEMEATCGR